MLADLGGIAAPAVSRAAVPNNERSTAGHRAHIRRRVVDSTTYFAFGMQKQLIPLQHSRSTNSPREIGRGFRRDEAIRRITIGHRSSFVSTSMKVAGLEPLSCSARRVSGTARLKRFLHFLTKFSAQTLRRVSNDGALLLERTRSRSVLRLCDRVPWALQDSTAMWLLVWYVPRVIPELSRALSSAANRVQEADH